MNFIITIHNKEYLLNVILIFSILIWLIFTLFDYY